MTFTAAQIQSVNTGSGPTPTPAFNPNGFTMQTLGGALPPPAPTKASEIGSNLGNTFSQGGKNAVSAITDIPKNAQNAGNSPLAKVAAVVTAAGHEAGNIGGTAGGILGSVITPFLPDSVKNAIGDATKYVSDKVNSIPGMTPEIAKSLGDLFNTGSLAIGENAETPATNIAKTGVKIAGKAIESGVNDISDAASNIKNSLPTLGSKSVESATVARDTAAQTGVKSLQDMTESVGDYKNDLGTSFKQGAQDIETNNPNAKLNLTSDQMQALNQLKENKSFALPEYLKPTTTPNNLGDIENSGKLSPTQAQDLITQLNRSTFTEKASGMGVDQTKIGLTNDIKNAASKSFGSDWDKVYGDYSKGRDAVDKISDIVNIDKNATASDINKSLNSIKKLSSTPEGKIILKNAVGEFKNTSGIDLTKGTDAISDLMEKEEALEKAKKGGVLKQAFNPAYLGRTGVRIGAGYALYKILHSL